MVNVKPCKVSGTSVPKSVAGYIAYNVEENHDVQVQAIGAAAVNQSMKAIAIARAILAKKNVDLVCSPSFSVLSDKDKNFTVMELLVQKQQNQLVS